MPNLRGKTWTTTTPANVEDAQYWEDHLISDADAAKIGTVILPIGGTAGQVLTKQSSTANDATWEAPASSGHTIKDEDGVSMTQQPTLQFLNADVTNDSVNSATVVDCKGAKGDAATIAVGTTTTLSAGSDATVTNSGTSSAAVFNFGIPKGADGADGADGSDGADGVSVTGVALLSTSGKVKTYRMSFSDGDHFDYQVTDGADGSGAGDMLSSDYDADSTVLNAGGITSYVASQAYTLPTAASNVLGGVKVGTNLSIADGVLSATDTKALSSMTDVAISSATDGQVLTYDGTASKWKNASLPSETINDLSDVTISSASNGQALLYNSTSGKWENGDVAGSAANISYNNTSSGLTASNVQDAVDELHTDITNIDTKMQSTLYPVNNVHATFSASDTFGDVISIFKSTVASIFTNHPEYDSIIISETDIPSGSVQCNEWINRNGTFYMRLFNFRLVISDGSVRIDDVIITSYPGVSDQWTYAMINSSGLATPPMDLTSLTTGYSGGFDIIYYGVKRNDL